MPVGATLPAAGHDDDDDEDDEDGEDDGAAGLAAGVDEEPAPEPLELDEDDSLVEDEPAASPLDDEAPSPAEVLAAARDDDPRLSVL